jgi:ABC-type glycerol-3-phosphate transport system substrate-binding protein
MRAADTRREHVRATVLLAAAVGALALAGCGSDEPSSQASTTDEVTTVEATTEETTPSAPTETTPEPKPKTIVIVVDQGRPRGGIKRPKLDKGEKIVLVIRADAGEAVHIHGYDVEEPVVPGKALRIPLTAAIPGRFEVELHHPNSLLAVLQVQP